MVIQTTTNSKLNSNQKRTNYYTSKIPDYNIEKMTSEQILNAKKYLESYDWSNINPSVFDSLRRYVGQILCEKRPEKFHL